MSNPFISLLFLIIFFGSFFGILHTKKLHKHVISGDISDQLESDQANRVPSAGLVPIEEDAEFGVANGEFDGVPPGFENVLPKEILQEMRELHRNRKLTIHQKQLEFDRIMSSVPSTILAKLPLPQGFEVLPEHIQRKIRKIHGQNDLDWKQKTRKVHELINSLPSEQRPRPIPPPANHPRDFFPSNPPPGFEQVLPPETFKQLLTIHRNQDLNPQQKGQQIDQIMRALPQDIVDQLPLPPGFDRLPENERKKAKAIFGDRNLSFKEKDRKVFAFVKSLPPHLRRLIRPALPSTFERLNPETKNQIGHLFDNEDLDDQQRQKKFWDIVNGLPDNEKSNVQDALNMKIPEQK